MEGDEGEGGSGQVEGCRVNLLNRMWTRQEVIEQWRIPLSMEAEIFSVLKPFTGHGASAMYLESIVDKQLDRYFTQKGRPLEPNTWSSPDKEKVMKQSWADTVKNEGDAPVLAGLEPLLVDEEQAADLLGVSRRLIFNLNKQGVLPSLMVGSRKKYSVKKLREFADGEVA